MKTIPIYPAEILSRTLICGGDKNPNRDSTLTPKLAKARRMRSASKAATDPETGIAYGVRDNLGSAGAGSSDIWTAPHGTSKPAGASASLAAIHGDGYAFRFFANGALVRESALWGARALWRESGLWEGSAGKGDSAPWGESALWGKALYGERRRRMQPAVVKAIAANYGNHEKKQCS